MRKCKFPNCCTRLSRFNAGLFCFYHSGLLAQRNIEYQRKRFFHYVFNGSRRVVGVYLDRRYVKHLKPVEAAD